MCLSSSFTAKSCAVCSSANLREKSGSVPCEETITATDLAYQALSQQNPVQYARRRVCGNHRDRFHLKKPLCLSCKPTNLNPNLLQQTYAAEASMLQQLQQKCLVFRACFSGGRNADKSRLTAFAKSRYARQNSHVFPCDSQTNRMPNVLCVHHKHIQQRSRIYQSRKVTLCNGCLKNVDCFRAGGAAAPRACVRRSSFDLWKKSTTGSCRAIFLPCKPTDPFLFLFADMCGQVAAFSRTTATQYVYQALLQQNPVQYARRPTCRKIGIGSVRRNHCVC